MSMFAAIPDSKKRASLCSGVDLFNTLLAVRKRLCLPST